METNIFAAVNRWAYMANEKLIEQSFHHLGFWPNVALPSRFAEKILWRKLFDHNPDFIVLSDKLLARAWMAERCPVLHVARTIWSGERAADIPASIFEGGIVLKANHGSGFNIVLPRGAAVDRDAVARKLDAWIATDFSGQHAEWAYNGIERKIFAEELLPISAAEPLGDYIFYCCDGQVLHFVVTVGEKTPQEAIAWYDADCERIYEPEGQPGYGKEFLPREYRLSPLVHDAIRAAAVLSRGLDFVRVDFMLANAKLYAGEMTLYPNAGYGKSVRLNVMQALGEKWDLRKSWFLSSPQTGDRARYAAALRHHLDSLVTVEAAS